MQRWSAVVVGAFMMLMIGALVLKGGHRTFITEAPHSDAGVERQGSGEGGILDDPMFADDLEMDAGQKAAAVGADAEPAAPLPSGSPKMVRFGVILIQYRGAQAAPTSSRSKEDALILAHSVAEAARIDFRTQVARGDSGSMDDAGRIPRGVLEPSVEYALFTLSAGGVSEPVDTPRGYWIVKRIE
jgi:hypothetical protein